MKKQNKNSQIGEDSTQDYRIYVSKDYDKLHHIVGNREINHSNLIKVKESMLEHGYIGSPIIVDKNFGVVDGQHRWQACRETNIPMEYIIRDYGDEEMKILNSIKRTWSKWDSLMQYKILGKGDYMELYHFIKKHDWIGGRIDIAGRLMSNGKINWWRDDHFVNGKRIWEETFRGGKWTVKSLDLAEDIVWYIEYLRNENGGGYKNAYANGFVKNLVDLMLNKDKLKFNKERFADKLQTYRGELLEYKITNKKDFVTFFNYIYNLNLKRGEKRFEIR